MDSKTVTKPNRVSAYTFNLFQRKNTPVVKSDMFLCQYVCKSFPCLYFFLLCLEPCTLSIHWKKRVYIAPQAKPPFHTFHALPGHVHTWLIRTGMLCSCSWDGSLKSLGLGTAPALFPFSPCHILSRKHFICGSGRAYVV